jgi:Taurine catabolism dioxygenase TauD, TfdA family
MADKTISVRLHSAAMELTADERSFIEQRWVFLELALQLAPTAPSRTSDLLDRAPAPVDPVIVERLELATDEQCQAMAQELTSGSGVVHVVPEHFSRPPDGTPHPLLALAARLRPLAGIGFPIPHPAENDPEASRLFGPPDGTVKIYTPPSGAGSREHGEMFSAHHDGLGYAGLLHTVFFSLDSPPLWGGMTYFQNLLLVAIALAREDPDAFAALFLPDAITVLLPTGQGAIKVQAPVLYLGPDGRPQVFFRANSQINSATSKETGEIEVTWRRLEALSRAQRLLELLTKPLAPGSRFVQLMRPGETIIVNNRHVVHGRTPYLDPVTGPGRVLARKWFVPSERDAVHCHAPAVEIDPRFARFFPKQFSADRTRGDWHYDADLDDNVLVAPRP